MNYYIYERLFENQNKFQNLKDQVNYTFRELYRIVRYIIFGGKCKFVEEFLIPPYNDRDKNFLHGSGSHIKDTLK